MAKSWLSYANVSDRYELKARLLPGLLSVLPLLPAGAAWGVPFLKTTELIVGGTAVGVVSAVGLSYLASAMGNHLQAKLWPRWPHDSPTNSWLNPYESERSSAQRGLWYAAANRLVAIDIEKVVVSGSELEATINDAVSALRYLFWNRPEAERLRMHNIDYGFARNLTGMRSIWIALLLASAIACWAAFFALGGAALLWAVVSTGLAFILIPMAFCVLPDYVRTKANHYTESFFGTLRAVERVQAAG